MTGRRAPGTRWLSPVVLGFVCIAVAACGKKGPPLAPIIRLPAAVQGVTAERVGHDVYVSLTVPDANVDRTTPVDIAFVELYVFTGAAAPPRAMFIEQATRIARVPVVPLPAEGETPSETGPDAVRPGATITLTDSVVGPVPDGTRRFYMALPLSTRNRPGLQHAPVEVTFRPAPPPPDGIAVSYTASAINIAWLPRPAMPPAQPDGRTAAPAPRVNVYLDVAPAADASVPVWRTARPAPLNSAPLEAPPFSEPVVFGAERCYVLRSVTGQGEMAVEGDASPRSCVTPVDTFAPAAPAQLVAIATGGAINLLWEANAEPDLAGYIVLRGAVGDARLQPLTAAPIAEVRFSDTTVTSGMRYVYAVVAVDRQTPVANTSVESARVEETAR